MGTKAPDNRTTQVDRLCEHFASRTSNRGQPERAAMRGDLNLCRDSALRRRYHGFYEDLLN